MKNKGFTLIELMIAISLVLIMTVSGSIYLNDFNRRQKLDGVTNNVKSMVSQAQNYAKVKQPPHGDSSGEVKYVQLYKTVAGNIEAKVNDVGTTYFSNKISESEITITFGQPILYFWGGTGQMSSDVNGNFFDSNQTTSITIMLNQGVAETRNVIINSLGGVQ